MFSTLKGTVVQCMVETWPSSLHVPQRQYLTEYLSVSQACIFVEKKRMVCGAKTPDRVMIFRLTTPEVSNPRGFEFGLADFHEPLQPQIVRLSLKGF